MANSVQRCGVMKPPVPHPPSQPADILIGSGTQHISVPQQQRPGSRQNGNYMASGIIQYPHSVRHPSPPDLAQRSRQLTASEGGAAHQQQNDMSFLRLEDSGMEMYSVKQGRSIWESGMGSNLEEGLPSPPSFPLSQVPFGFPHQHYQLYSTDPIAQPLPKSSSKTWHTSGHIKTPNPGDDRLSGNFDARSSSETTSETHSNSSMPSKFPSTQSDLRSSHSHTQAAIKNGHCRPQSLGSFYHNLTMTGHSGVQESAPSSLPRHVDEPPVFSPASERAIGPSSTPLNFGKHGTAANYGRSCLINTPNLSEMDLEERVPQSSSEYGREGAHAGVGYPSLLPPSLHRLRLPSPPLLASTSQGTVDGPSEQVSASPSISAKNAAPTTLESDLSLMNPPSKRLRMTPSRTSTRRSELTPSSTLAATCGTTANTATTEPIVYTTSAAPPSGPPKLDLARSTPSNKKTRSSSEKAKGITSVENVDTSEVSSQRTASRVQPVRMRGKQTTHGMGVGIKDVEEMVMDCFERELDSCSRSEEPTNLMIHLTTQTWAQTSASVFRTHPEPDWWNAPPAALPPSTSPAAKKTKRKEIEVLRSIKTPGVKIVTEEEDDIELAQGQERKTRRKSVVQPSTFDSSSAYYAQLHLKYERAEARYRNDERSKIIFERHKLAERIDLLEHYTPEDWEREVNRIAGQRTRYDRQLEREQKRADEIALQRQKGGTITGTPQKSKQEDYEELALLEATKRQRAILQAGENLLVRIGAHGIRQMLLRDGIELKKKYDRVVVGKPIDRPGPTLSRPSPEPSRQTDSARDLLRQKRKATSPPLSQPGHKAGQDSAEMRIRSSNERRSARSGVTVGEKQNSRPETEIINIYDVVDLPTRSTSRRTFSKAKTMLATSQQGSIPGEVEFANSEALHPKQHAEPSLISRSLSASLASNDAQPSQPSRKPVPVPQHTRVPSSRLDQFQQIRMSDKPVLLEAADRRFARESATTGSRGDSAATSVRRGVRAAAVLPFGIPMDKMVSAKPEEGFELTADFQEEIDIRIRLRDTPQDMHPNKEGAVLNPMEEEREHETIYIGSDTN